MNELMTVISTVGFPIVSFLIAAYFIKYTYDKTQEANKEALNKIGALAEAVNNNSAVLMLLAQKINEKDDDEDGDK